MMVATDASLDAEAFDPIQIFDAVDGLLHVVTEIWAGGPGSPHGRASLIERWARSVAADLGGEPRLIRSRVQLLSVINRRGELEDRIALRVRLRVALPKGVPRSLGDPRSLSLDVRWTLARVGRGWRLLTIDHAARTDQALANSLIPGAWADEDRLREEALGELADADAVLGPVHLRELVRAYTSVAQQLSEITQVDRRFDSDLLDARLKRIVETWEGACTGSPDLLSDVAAEGAIQMLLHGPERPDPLRLILHDATIDDWKPVALELSAAPQIRIVVTVSAVRYVLWDRTGAWATGDSQTRHEMTMDWTLTLHRGADARWQLTSTSSPLASKPDPARPGDGRSTTFTEVDAESKPARGKGLFSAANQAVYSQPAPEEGSWTGRADQAPLQLWLKRRRARNP
jgi:hypothetical protein